MSNILETFCGHNNFIYFTFQRLTGASPENLEELREIALDVEEDGEEEHDDLNEAGQSEEDDSDYSQCDLDDEQAGPSERD